MPEFGRHGSRISVDNWFNSSSILLQDFLSCYPQVFLVFPSLPTIFSIDKKTG